MKKLAKIFAVVVVCVLALTALVGCVMPNLNYDDAVANLKENEYTVVSAKSGDVAAVGVFATVAVITGANVEDIDAAVMAQKGSDSVTIVWLKTAEAADACYDTIKAAMEANDSETKDAVYGQSGKVVFFGTTAGIKATK